MFDAIFITDINNPHYTGRAIGAYKCADVLRQSGYECLVVDHVSGFTQSEVEAVLHRAITPRTLFVGISSTFLNNGVVANKLFSLHLPNTVTAPVNSTALIKKISPNCKIVFGGTRAGDDISNTEVDYVVTGYAEAAILNLANHLKYNLPLENRYRNIHGVTIVTNNENIGYDFVNNTFSWTKDDVANIKVLPIEISRGCIFKCKFCSYPLNGKKNLDFIRTADNMYQELQDSYDRFGVTDYILLDDTFNDNEPKLDTMLAVVKRLSFRPKFWAYTRLDLIARKPELIDKLYDIGLRSLYFGIETLNKKSGLIVGKGYDRTKQINMIAAIRKKYGNEVLMHGSFIVGLPDESIKSVNTTFRTLMDNTIPLHSFTFGPLGIVPPAHRHFPSEFEKNYTNYGYTDGPLAEFNLIRWKNEHMTYDIAKDMAANFMNEANSSNRMYIPSHLGISMKNLGYSDDYIQNTKFNEINWDTVAVAKNTFVYEYKKLLFGRLGIDI